jgi:hypothetical protein
MSTATDGRTGASALVLAEQLEDNPEGNLTERQVQYASVIRASGIDLLVLIDDVADLARAESNTLALEIGKVALAELRDSLAEQLIPVGMGQGTGFAVELDPTLPPVIRTDPHHAEIFEAFVHGEDLSPAYPPARASACRSAAASSIVWTARSPSKARWARAARSRCSCRCIVRASSRAFCRWTTTPATASP